VTELHRLGFTMLGDSLWFHPYPCVDVLSSLIAYCGLSDYVLVAEVARLDENSSRRLHRAHPDMQR
jgi:DNA-binding transcriptional regulator PaaX